MGHVKHVVHMEQDAGNALIEAEGLGCEVPAMGVKNLDLVPHLAEQEV